MNLFRTAAATMLIVAAACGGGGASTGPGNTGGNNNGGNNNGGGSQCPSGSVCMLSSTFTPTSITVTKGSSVTFSNGSGVFHTVNFDGTRPPGVDDVPLNSSGDFPRTFTEVGTFNFHCTQHAGMTGKVIVQ